MSNLWAQNDIKMSVVLDNEKKILIVNQEINFLNTTNKTINSIILNDWNNAYSDKNSLLGKRFSDEFVRNFQIAKDADRGKTSIIDVFDENKNPLAFGFLIE